MTLSRGGRGRAVIIGGSLGGLFAANLLMRNGWEVDVFERAPEELQGRGAGIVTHQELFDALQLAGLTVDESIGVRVQERVALAVDGSRAASCAMPQILTAWSRLYFLLRSGIPAGKYHVGKNLVGLEQSSGAVVATFADGSQAGGDFLVGADGIRSTVRQLLLPQVRPAYAGYVAWRGLVEEAVLSPRARLEAFPYFGFGLPADEQFIGYPVAGSNNSVDAGRRRYNFVWYRPADDQSLRDLLTDADGKFWPEGIPPPKIRPDVLERAKVDAQRVLAPQFAEVVERSSGLLFQPIYDVASPQIAFGRAVLLGDAAFVARPHCGMGVTKAAGDAMALSKALASEYDVRGALGKYEAERLVVGKHIVEHARKLGSYLEAHARGSASGLKRGVEEVMKTTAVALHTESAAR